MEPPVGINGHEGFRAASEHGVRGPAPGLSTRPTHRLVLPGAGRLQRLAERACPSDSLIETQMKLWIRKRKRRGG